jgi:hypothetical protein
MAPKINLLNALAGAIKEGMQNIFPALYKKSGRPKETTTETPNEETKQSTAAALEEAHREQPSPSSAGRQKRKDPPPASKDVITGVKQRNENWSEDKERANSEALSMKAFANIEDIPPPFSRYATGKQEVEAI